MRKALGGAGVAVLAMVATASMAAADPVDDPEDVDVRVVISPLSEPGALAMSVAANSATLTESGSTALARQFVGTLPTVTVTDTRDADDIPEGAWWWVEGTASDFVSDPAGLPDIAAGHLGWTPHLVNGGALGFVAEGPEIPTVMDPRTTTDPAPPDNVGLVGQEMLASVSESADVAAEDEWSANADLVLRVPTTTASGTYHSTLTLSLFE